MLRLCQNLLISGRTIVKKFLNLKEHFYIFSQFGWCVVKIICMKIILKGEEKKIPHIIGLKLEDILKITADKISSLVSTDGLFLIADRTSFVPPDETLINKIADYILSKKKVKFKDVFAITDDPEDESGFEIDTDLAFKIKSGFDFSRAVKIVQGIKNRMVCENSFLISPEETFISLDSEIGEGCVIYPYTLIVSSIVERDVMIYQGNTILSSKIGKGTEILPYCYIEGADINENVKVGPFCRMRPSVVVKSGAKIGNFAEIKNSEIGENTKIQHFSYIGDAVIGKDVNIGAGTVTCNFDGVKKNQTIIEDGAFVGSGSMLIAPLKLGHHSYIGAGSAINKNVPPYSLAVERAEIRIIHDWAKSKFKKKEEK